jgi:hypothetical protein
MSETGRSKPRQGITGLPQSRTNVAANTLLTHNITHHDRIALRPDCANIRKHSNLDLVYSACRKLATATRLQSVAPAADAGGSSIGGKRRTIPTFFCWSLHVSSA